MAKATRKSIGDPWGWRSLYVFEIEQDGDWLRAADGRREKPYADQDRRNSRDIFQSNAEWKRRTRVALYVRVENESEREERGNE